MLRNIPREKPGQDCLRLPMVYDKFQSWIARAVNLSSLLSCLLNAGCFTHLAARGSICVSGAEDVTSCRWNAVALSPWINILVDRTLGSMFWTLPPWTIGHWLVGRFSSKIADSRRQHPAGRCSSLG